MDRFEGPFHQSDLRAYLKCPRSLYYGRVMGMERERISMANLAGRAGHFAIYMAHEKNVWDPEWLFEMFRGELEQEQARAVADGLEVHGQVEIEKYRIMLGAYAVKPWNREEKVLLNETEFYFEIRPGKTDYQFAGRIDQVLEIPTGLLRNDFPEVVADIGQETVLIHRDLKFGRRKECSPFELALNPQIDVYAYALWKGAVERQGEDCPPELVRGAGDYYQPEIVPDFHVIYFLQDEIPYTSDGGAYLKGQDGGRVRCDLVSTPCLVGKSQKPCEGKRAWCTKQRRGPGMYFTTRPESRLKEIPRELGRVCASIRMGHYPRNLGELCHNYCAFRAVCEAEVLEEVQAA